MSIEKAEADLAKWEARANALETELAGARAEINRIKIYLELSKRYGAGSRALDTDAARVELNRLNGTNGIDHASTGEDAPLSTDEALVQACHGKSIPDAAIALIRLAGRPLSEEEIVDRLIRGGVTLVSESPALNVRFSLLRKRKDTGAVRQTDDKLWDVDESATLESETQKSSGFLQNRNRNNHAERSRQGLLEARKRGVKNGRKFTITPEIKKVAEDLMAEGAKFGDIAELIGVSAPTFNRWRKLGLVSARKSSNPDTTSDTTSSN